jgi:hypothetical protein
MGPIKERQSWSQKYRHLAARHQLKQQGVTLTGGEQRRNVKLYQ